VFWKANAKAGDDAEAVIAAVGDKWIKTKGSNDQLTEFCNLVKLVGVLYQQDADAKGEIAEVNGVPANELTSEHDGATTHTWVAIDVPHYVVKVETEGGDEPSTMTFSDFDKELNLTAPTADEIADLGQ
jgi:hypothetical protein